MRVLGFDWFGILGDLPRLEHVGLWGWLAVVTGIIWILAAVGLWALQPWARLFAMIIAGFALFEAVLAFFQFPGTGVALRDGDHAGLDPVVPEHRRGEGRVRRGRTGGGTGARRGTGGAAPVAAPVAAAAAIGGRHDCAEAGRGTGRRRGPGRRRGGFRPRRGRTPRHQMKIEDVEGIGSAYAEKLAAVGIKTTDDLLSAGAKPYDRERIAQQTGISGNLIRDWVDKVDLMRVPGVGPQYSDLLEAAGVGSPAELAQRNPANLAITVQEVIAARPGIVRRTPSESEIAAWIEEAGKLDKIVEH